MPAGLPAKQELVIVSPHAIILLHLIRDRWIRPSTSECDSGRREEDGEGIGFGRSAATIPVQRT